MQSAVYKSPIGSLKLVVCYGAVVACHFTDMERDTSFFLKRTTVKTIRETNKTFEKEHNGEDTYVFEDNIEDNIVLTHAMKWLDGYFSGQDAMILPTISLYCPQRTETFLHTIKTLNFGSTYTYTQVANMCNTHPISLGQACAKNPILLFIPCHRVVSKTSKNIYAYAGGEHRKKWLIDFEAHNRRKK